MKGKICDRCGVLYSAEVISPIYKKVTPHGVMQNAYYEEIDLCQACKESFTAWMNFYEGTKKPNQDYSDPWVKMKNE